MKKLITNISDNEEEVEVSNSSIRITDQTIEIVEKTADGYIVRFNDEEFKVDEIIDLPDEGLLRVHINNYSIDVIVEDPINKALAGSKGVSGDITSPMSGQISNILVKEGQTVEAGELLLIVSAMKMENQIVAPITGVVSTINIKNNDKVPSGKLLLTIEPKKE